jgi:hypothetical protein
MTHVLESVLKSVLEIVENVLEIVSNILNQLASTFMQAAQAGAKLAPCTAEPGDFRS